ncbi:hypothetical protein AVEN_41865-1 [Araneus ventricosus]|uniref:Uncharacterized protein n=1 Tax=Araneus ventricosus TaxID=182803 RepID=A0A4Y2ACR9_ARAVE|nr:hypothetical protein AVEN_41865-1 [Araneus ventricosus]
MLPKCELHSVIRFLQAEGWFVENDQCSCFLSDFARTAKSDSDFCSCLHSWQRPPSHGCCNPAASGVCLELVCHSAYSPDLATSDFYLFPELKNWLGGQSYQKN